MSENDKKARIRGLALAVTALSALVMGSRAAALDSSAARDYEIPAGSVATALNRLADKSGAQLIYDAALTRTIKTRGLRGRHTLSDALNTLLSGTGLAYRLAPNGSTVAIMLAPNETSVQNGASTQNITSAQNETNAQASAGGIALPTVDVTTNRLAAPGGAGGEGDGDPTGTRPGESGGRFTGYSAVDAIAATKTNIPILQTPVSVDVVTRETMDDQQAINIQDALVGNVPNVYLAPNSYSGAFPFFIIRGLGTGTLYYNGLSVPPGVDTETSNIQSIEVLKGPASVLFGRIEPGGLIWVQSKRPQETPYFSIQEQAGAFGTTRTTIDATGPLTHDKTWLYRFNADVSNINQYADFVYSKDLFLSPAVTYHPIEQFKLYIEGQYHKATQIWSFSNNIVRPGWDTPAPGVPIGRYIGDPAFADANPNVEYTRQLYFDWTFNIGPDWALTNRGLYQDLYVAGGISQLSGPAGDPNVYLFDSIAGTPQRSVAGNLDLTGKFTTGPLQHAVLLGTDFNNSVTEVSAGTIYYPSSVLNIYNPIYFPSSFSFNNPNNLTLFNHEAYNWKGVYAQDMVSAINDSVHLLVGGRYDWADTGNLVNNPSFTPQQAVPLTYTEDRAFSPRIGLLYQPLPWFSFYGSHSTSFGVTNGINPADLQLLPPSKGKQWEGGAKAEFFDKRLSATVAYFDIFKTNIPTSDPTNPLNTLLTGLVQSKGVDFGLTGKMNDNWSLIANFSHEDVRTVVGQPYNPLTEIETEHPVAGNWLPSVPANAGNLWAKYSADGDFKGLNLMVGINVIGSRWGDNANSFKIGEYALVNGGISYRFPWQGAKITAQVNVANLLNTTYYVSAADRQTIISGTPRSILGSLRLEF
jgi:iron complex outermembrane receptor protein